jgi:flagellar protein FliS
MNNAALAARSAYTTNSVATASPARLLMMLYDRLVRDLMLAEQAIDGGQGHTAHEALLHAQQILLELDAMLDKTAWDGAQGLSDLYDFAYRELVAANVAKDAPRIAACRGLIEPLRDAWREAAMKAAAS